MGKFLLSQKGISTVEVILASAMALGMGLVSMQLMQGYQSSKNSMESSMDSMELHSRIAKSLQSSDGCLQLLGLREGDEVRIKAVLDKEIDSATGKMIMSFGEELYYPGKQLGGVQIQSMEISGLKRLEQDQAGIMIVKTQLLGKNKQKNFNEEQGSRVYARDTMIPVVIDDTGAVIDCQTQKVDLVRHIRETVCDQLFIRDSEEVPNIEQPLECAEMILFAQFRLKQKICADITGKPKSTVLPENTDANGFLDLNNQEFCQLKLTHAGKSCAEEDEYAYGFGANGELLCRPI